MANVELTAQGSGYYRVLVNGAELSRHTTEREAAQEAVKKALNDPAARVEYDHDYRVTAVVELDVPLPDPEPEPEPEPQPEPPPSSAGAVRLFVDYAQAALGSSLASVSDNGKWDSVLGVANGAVIDAPAGWPTHKVLRVLSPDGARDGAHIVSRSGLGEVPIGSTRNWRFYYAAFNGFGGHPIQDGGAVSQSNWYFVSVRDEGNLGPNEWGVHFNLSGESSFSTYKWGLWSSDGVFTTKLQRGVPYRVEVQVVRVSTTQMRFHVWVHDAAGNLIASDPNFRGPDGQLVLSSNPLLGINSPANMGIYVAGLNGTSGPWPLHNNDQGAHAIVDGLPEGQQIGAYGSVTGEVPR